MKIKDGFLLKNLAGSYVIIPIGENMVDFKLMITLNETSAFLWKCLETSQTLDQLTDSLTAEYDVSHEIARNDIEKFLQQLRDKGLIEDK